MTAVFQLLIRWLTITKPLIINVTNFTYVTIFTNVAAEEIPNRFELPHVFLGHVSAF